MIGIRAALLGLLGATVTGVALGPGGPDPSVELSANRLVVERGAAAERGLAALEEALAASLESARRGAARIVTGDERPGPHLRTAAAQARDADPIARHAGSALQALAAARRARHPAAASPEPPVGGGELASIAGQLEATAEAGDEFAAMRLRMAEVPAALDAALSALDEGDRGDASRHVEAARTAFADVRAWEVDLVTLPVWIETIGAMIRAVETLVEAVAVGDAALGEQAAEAFAVASDEARVADRALRIAISEGGSAVSAAALGRLARALEAVHAARMEVAVILQAARR
ncbi:MAG TPA: hypothetical protein VM253_11125 [Candidatus Limnocylindrales bacterium]|nr:hypothetical protein [Candidatus Limnocylindrales bacterium]